MNYGTEGDVVMAISGSGKSANVLNTVDWANRHGLTTFGLTGFNGGNLKQTQQAGIHLPRDDMGMVEIPTPPWLGFCRCCSRYNQPL